jgi:aminomethyltransferase
VSETAQKTTPLYEEHVRRGAKIIPFGGWLMPVQYTSIMDEHQAVRNNVGIFDISHMGQLMADGSGARMAEHHAHKQHRQTQCRHWPVRFC